MNNKILIKVIVPELSSSYDVFIPFNEVVWKINKMITKVVFDLQEIKIDIRRANYMLINKNSGRICRPFTDRLRVSGLFFCPLRVIFC